MTLTTACLPVELPIHDLRPFVNEDRLIELALAAVQKVTETPATDERGEVAAPASRQLLALLTYCYVVGAYGSDDVEWACQNDLGARHIYNLETRHTGTHTLPSWESLRRFRFDYCTLVEACVARVLAQLDRLLPSSMASPRIVPARQRVEIAMMMDTTILD